MEKAITQFLGCEPETEHFDNPSRHISWYYEGANLKYELMLDRQAKTVSVSGDFMHPFSATSLYEICILYDRVAIETEPTFYGDQKILVFRKDYEGNENFKCLMIMKWGNGELSVWPNIYDAHLNALKEWDDAN